MYRGVFHAHSRHSYDAQTPLPELCAELQRRGYSFLLLTEHDDTLDAGDYEKIVAECAGLRSAEFLVIPGIEVRCWRSEKEQWHIAALGVQTWIPRGPIPQVVAAIHQAGGLAVFLHPYKYSQSVDLAELKIFDGVELWNGKEDGHYSPPRKTVQLGRRICREIRVPLYYGHDLHDLNAAAPLALEVDAGSLAASSILSQLGKGSFGLDARGMRFSAREGPSAAQMLRMLFLRSVYTFYGALRRVPVVGTGLGAVVGVLRSGPKRKKR